MPFDWAHYLRLAQFLQVPNPQIPNVEAADRTTASREYYRAYCQARNYARDRQQFQPQNTAEDHRRVRDHFVGHHNPQLAADLDKLRQWRNMCDYDDSVSNLALLVTQAVAKAQGVLQALI